MLVNVLFPINAEAFTYTVPDDQKNSIRPGVFVQASFRNRKKTGIVTGIFKSLPSRKDLELKPLETVLGDYPLISGNLLKLLSWVSQYYLSTTGIALKNAVPSGIFEGKKGGISRITYDSDVKAAGNFQLTREQKNAISAINTSPAGAFLLHGVTGSGKTEIYIRAIENLRGKEAIVLVPEIALTAQIIDRFRSRFQNRVAILHSGLSPGEKIAQWRKIMNGEVSVAIGVRSAVFAPFNRLGLIVVDEEHESSYKQFEGLRYSARDVALARAKIEGIKIILGSATPSLESYYNAAKGNIRYLELKNRIEKKPLPEVKILDMTKEDKESWSFSSTFLNALKENVSHGRQAILMLNRRGYSPFLMCMDCGYTYKCPACSITLTYHKDTGQLKCHYCGSYLKPRDLCPKCSGSKTKSLGTGTQRVEEELRSLMPGLLLKRMDRDTTQRKLAHYRIVKEMEQNKIDILVGTQMVAKGHDFPDVTLSGIVLADVALNLPDFRSSEKTFQLFTQLAGRSGRGEAPGEVYIQTYESDHYIFKFVKKHDYQGFYRMELELRKELAYPPFSRLIRIIFSFRSKEPIGRVMNTISGIVNKTRLKDIEVLGPSPAPLEKIRNLWRWHLVLKGKKAKHLRKCALEILKSLKDIKNIRIDIDVDPINLL
jgi:primosomal protein N' (replication factor Y)